MAHLSVKKEHKPGDYSGTELLICLVARLMENRKMAFIGTGVPMLAASLAKKLHAPEMMAVFEFGGTDPVLDRLPLNVGGQQTFHRAISALSLSDVMEAAQRGQIEFGFLGGAQIDMYGNINTTCIGDHMKPKVRLPGSGGGCDIGSLCWRTIGLLTDHDPRKLVRKVDFVTTAGYLDGPGARERAGLPKGSGPYRVVTNLATLDYHPTTRKMRLLALNPGISVEMVIERTGFELEFPRKVGSNEAPTDEELRVLRKEVDPTRLYI
jgi:glutaconate CoA-transferase subunit B